jgi:hypothetical protein
MSLSLCYLSPPIFKSLNIYINMVPLFRIKKTGRRLQISILPVSNTHSNTTRYLSRNKKINFLFMDTAWKYQDMS